jgi:hypothetical protein
LTIRRQTLAWTIALTLAFAFRLAYGLSSDFFTEDERQVYLIGLKSFARAEWPYFGADVVWTGSQLPGALQGMLVRLPLEVWPVPEAPFVLLNLLSFGALALLAWYCARRVPDIPRWFVWALLLTVPWTLNFSTHVVNTSYILPGSTVFFVGWFEASPSFRRGFIAPSLAWGMMGAGLLFLVQIHMSWVLLPAYVAVAAADVLWNDRRHAGRYLAGFLAGAALTGAPLVPTLLRYGLSGVEVQRNIELRRQSPATLFVILARFLSFPAFEINRFAGLSFADRALFLLRQPWVVPFALLAGLAGVVQPVLAALLWFRRAPDLPEWRRVKVLAAVTPVWIFASFFFSVRGPLAHAFYVVFPVSALYTFYAVRFLASTWLWRGAAAVLAAGVVFHAGLALDRAPRRSLYSDRDVVRSAIDVPNDRFLGDRRDSAIEHQDRRPRPIDAVLDDGAFERARPDQDLAIARATWAPALFGRVSSFDVTIRNQSRVAAYLDIRLAAAYTGATGQTVARREVVIKSILQPGSVRTWTGVTDGSVPDGAVAASLAVLSAEKCIPAFDRPLQPAREP